MNFIKMWFAVLAFAAFSMTACNNSKPDPSSEDVVISDTLATSPEPNTQDQQGTVNSRTETPSTSSGSQSAPATEDGEQLDSKWLTTAGAKLGRWASYHAQSIPGFNFEKFVVVDTFHEMDFPVLPLMEVDPAFEPYRIASPDGKLMVDIYSYERTLKKKKNGKVVLTGGSPDSEVTLYGKLPGNRVRLLFCGTPCHFEDAAWLNNNILVIAGYSNETNQKYQPMLWRIDLKDNSVWRYSYPGTLPDNKQSYVTSVVFAQ